MSFNPIRGKKLGDSDLRVVRGLIRARILHDRDPIDPRDSHFQIGFPCWLPPKKHCLILRTVGIREGLADICRGKNLGDSLETRKDPNMSYRRYPILPHLRPFLSFTSPNLTDEVIGGGNSTSCLQRCFALARQGGNDVM